MNTHDFELVQALRRVRVFSEAHAGEFPAQSQAAEVFARLAPLLAEVGEKTLEPGYPASPATRAKEALLEELWEDLKAIARTARAIGRDEAGFEAGFRLGDETQRGILNSAEGFLERLQSPETVAKFIAYDLPAGFVEDLRADLTAVAGRQEEQAEDLMRATGGTARVRSLLTEGRALLLRLDTSVRNRFRRDPAILAEWRTAARIHRTPRAAAVAPAPAAAPAAPAPADQPPAPAAAPVPPSP